MRSTNTWQTFGERTITVTHNTNGTYSATKSGSFTTTGNSTWNLKSGSASVTVKPADIPRYATANQSLNSVTASSIVMNWSSDSTIDYIWASINGGSSWFDISSVNATSGTYTISGLTPGTTYNVKTRVRRKDSQLTTDSSTLSITTLGYASITTFDLQKDTETSIKFTWSASKACDAIQYSLNGGNWTGGAYPTTTIGGLSENTQYSVKIRIKATDSQLWTESEVKYVTTYYYPHCTSATDFTIGNAFTLNFYNPLNRTMDVKVIGNDGSKIGSWSGTGTSITGFNHAEGIQDQYKSIPNSTFGYFKIQVSYGGVTHTRDVGNRYYIVGSEYPTFNNFVYEDTNEKIKALTGDSKILISGYSNLKVTISTANKAYSNYQTSIEKYRLNVGNMSSVETAYSSSQSVSMSINAVNSPSITVTAIDKRGLPKSSQITASFKAYTKPVILDVIAIRSENGVGEEVTLEFNGNWWQDTFGAITNTIKAIKYYYKKTTDSTYTEGSTEITHSTGNGNFYGNVLIEGDTASKGFDVSSAYNIKIIVTDELETSTEYIVTLGTGTPAIAIYDNKVAIGAKYDEKIGGNLQVDGYAISRKVQEKIMNLGNMTYNTWEKLCNIKFDTHSQGEFIYMKILIGAGNNGGADQNAYIDLICQLGWTGSYEGRFGCSAELHPFGTTFTTSNTAIKVIANSNIDYDIWFKTDNQYYCRPNYILHTSSKVKVTPLNELSESEPSGTACNLSYTSI